MKSYAQFGVPRPTLIDRLAIVALCVGLVLMAAGIGLGFAIYFK